MLQQIIHNQLRILTIFSKGTMMIKLFTRFIDQRAAKNSEITGKENYIIVIELLLSTTDFPYLKHHNTHVESFFEP